jgi:hypothetical protein
MLVRNPSAAFVAQLIFIFGAQARLNVPYPLVPILLFS